MIHTAQKEIRWNICPIFDCLIFQGIARQSSDFFVNAGVDIYPHEKYICDSLPPFTNTVMHCDIKQSKPSGDIKLVVHCTWYRC